jgi:hypothetical protein
MQLDRFVRAYARAPLMTKVTILARMLVDGEASLVAIAKLIALVVTLTACMSAEARVVIGQQLIEEGSNILDPPERRLLH